MSSLTPVLPTGGDAVANTAAVAVGHYHPDYLAWSPRWQKLRDLAAGEDAVKAGGRRYLACPESYTNAQFDRYLGRARVPEVIAPARNLVMARLFADPLQINLPRCLTHLEESASRCAGLDLNALTRLVASELLDVGRVGLLVHFDAQENRAYVEPYRAESIVNWAVLPATSQCRNPGLSLLVLEEVDRQLASNGFDVAEQRARLVLRINADGVLEQERWRLDADEGWQLVESDQPSLNGEAVRYIPFTLLSADGAAEAFSIARPLFEPLANAALRFYETSADLRNGLYLVGQPTPWASADWSIFEDDQCGPSGGNALDASDPWQHDACGPKKGLDGLCGPGDIRLGSDSFVSLPQGGALGFMEVSGTGFTQLRNELDMLRDDMLSLGARMLRKPDDRKSTATQARFDQAAEDMRLADIAGIIERGLTASLRECGRWSDCGEKELKRLFVALAQPVLDNSNALIPEGQTA